MANLSGRATPYLCKAYEVPAQEQCLESRVEGWFICLPAVGWLKTKRITRSNHLQTLQMIAFANCIANYAKYSAAKGDPNLEDRDLLALRPEAHLRFGQRSPAHRRLSQGVIREAAVALQGFCKVKGRAT